MISRIRSIARAPKRSSAFAILRISNKVEIEYIPRVLSESTTLDEAAATLRINVATLWRKRKRYHIE